MMNVEDEKTRLTYLPVFREVEGQQFGRSLHEGWQETHLPMMAADTGAVLRGGGGFDGTSFGICIKRLK